jgi:hypothetical protein
MNIPSQLFSVGNWFVTVLVFSLAGGLALEPVRATDENQDAAKTAAVAAMGSWLEEIDNGAYAKSWSDAAQLFQKAVTSEQWVTALNGVRKPLGKLVSRTLASSAYQQVPPKAGTGNEGMTVVIAQFDSSFDNLKYARETVTFEQEPDGAWRPAGYYIKPR